MTLHEIIEKWGSDKNLSTYTLTYEVIFEPYREKDISVLEVGIGTLLPGIPSTFIGNPNHYPHYKPGGSLRAWKEYFPNAQIYGADIAEDCMFEEDRIITFMVDSTDKTQCDHAFEGITFDIIIDDGLHEQEAQLATFKNLWNRLKTGGIYVIEDLLRPDLFKEEIAPEIRSWSGYSEQYNDRSNMCWLKKG